jgi:hypothetical protein
MSSWKNWNVYCEPYAPTKNVRVKARNEEEALDKAEKELAKLKLYEYEPMYGLILEND